MASKRKRVVLSLADKLKIIEQLDKGVTGKKLSEIYGVGQATICDIKNSKSTLLNFVSVLENEDGSSSRKTMKTATNKNLEDAVFKWFLQQRSMGNPISGPILCEKAKILAEKLGYSSFKACNGWLRNFKFRHGVRELDLAAESYDPEFVYNADETGLVWKALPKTTLASKRESSAPGHKVSKERVTVLNCANSAGNHKLPLLLIGKSKNPRAFKNVKKLPLFYKSQPKAWMTAALFTEWYDEVFISEVKKHQKSVKKEGSKVLLIVDNAPTHPIADLLERENGQFKTTFLPPNVTSLLQPMDQSVIETMKRHYRRQLLRKLLIEGTEDEELVLANHSKINLKDCCYMVAEAWSLVTAVTLRRAWNKLKGLPSEKNKEENGEDEDDEDALPLEEIRKMIVKIPGCTEVSAEDVGEWMACDTSDPGFQILNDDEIVESVREDVEVEVEEELSLDVEVDAGPSASEAFAGLETALKWMERQPECDHLQLLTVKRMRDLAARKRMKTAKQLTLTEMFKKQ
ncbi:jerky protein homolog-like [Daktulosphaira vitifoliae]|uniref:jerky protein homolog-like n=1 Tax=Daktulosphaira vitifoliae TaxID=58002 RepID=UPI0021A9830F|nr:jerky protein homolog-like [Daktulosphaira vitifoliae]